jgi:hypothetical protein
MRNGAVDDELRNLRTSANGDLKKFRSDALINAMKNLKDNANNVCMYGENFDDRKLRLVLPRLLVTSMTTVNTVDKQTKTTNYSWGAAKTTQRTGLTCATCVESGFYSLVN